MMTAEVDEDEPWYAVKLLLGWYYGGAALPRRYEERIVVFRAASFDDAIAQAEREAQDYCQSAAEGVEIRYEEYAHAFHLFEHELKHGTEVFSTMINSTLVPDDDYIARRYAPE